MFIGEPNPRQPGGDGDLEVASAGGWATAGVSVALFAATIALVRYLRP